MTYKEIEKSCSFRCAHCENSEKQPFSSLQSREKNSAAKIWIRNLPNGISEEGLKNLFITVGKPKSINYFASNNSALVEFDCIKKSELAIRDLNCKPPYNLNVTTATYDTGQSTEEKFDENWDFSSPSENVLENLLETTKNTEEKNEQLKKARYQLADIIKKLGYDPSIRMRQKKLDFETDTNCISLGRGYLNMGGVSRYVGGLQKFVLSSENSKAKKEVNFYCQICQASTTKMCGQCLKSYCSKVCLSNSAVDHQEKCSNLRSDKKKQSEGKGDSEHSSNQQKLSDASLEYIVFDRELTSGCTVVMSAFLTMESVFVRRSDKECEEKFTRLCNDVAEVALKGDKLKFSPKIGDIYIAKYYKDLCFYRARVRSVGQKAAVVVFVDFGNSQETKFEDIKPLPRYLKSVPELAVEILLSGMTEGSSLDSVDYYNRLTAEKIPLILEFREGFKDVVLREKDSKIVVNETACNYSLPSWKKDSSVLSKIGEVFFKSSLTTEQLKVGETYSLILCHFDEKEFLESDVFWVLIPDSDEFFHIDSEMRSRITEYCEFLKNDYYLPRTNELCLVEEEGKWHRCINLKSRGTTCCVFFVDDGHSSFIKSSNIRKMIQDFIEVPAQAICCTLPDDSKLKADKELSGKVAKYFKTCLGQRMDSIKVLKLMGDAYCLFIPEIQKMLV